MVYCDKYQYEEIYFENVAVFFAPDCIYFSVCFISVTCVIFCSNFGFCKQTGSYIMLAKLFEIILILITLYAKILKLFSLF